MERIRIGKSRSRRREYDACQTALRVEFDRAARRRSSLLRELDELLHDLELALERNR
jgi:hypothetical protein